MNQYISCLVLSFKMRSERFTTGEFFRDDYIRRTGRVAQLAECLLRKCEALSSNTSTTKKINNSK
jgi:hypothetical protein